MTTRQRFDAVTYRLTLRSYRAVLEAHASALDRMNVYPVPDGDTGTNMFRTVAGVADQLGVAGELEVADEATAGEAMAETCRAVSHASLMAARGNSGVILSQMLRALSGVLAVRAPSDGAAVADGLLAAAAAAYAAVLRPVEGTILTVAREAANAAERAARSQADLVAVLDAARSAGQDALARTPDLLPVLKAAGVVDAGGAGFLLLLDAALHVVDGRPLPQPDVAGSPTATPVEPSLGGLRFEVMYLLDLRDDAIGPFKEAWGALGDSIVVVGGDGLWNCHVHTDDIGGAIEAALELGGRPRAIRVSDLVGEQEAEHARREATLLASTPAGPPVATAVVAVASGAGLVALFRELGVQQVVVGGQTMNPSTAELLVAVEAAPATEVVLLPNNKNIVSVALQVQSLTAKRVYVLPTSSMPEGLSALVAYDATGSGEGNAEAMGVAAAGVATGEVTQAVRDALGPVGPIRAGDWMGLVAGDGVVVVADGVVAATTALLGLLVEADRELVTLVEGEGATAASTSAVLGWLTTNHPRIDVEVHRGGQPLYPYLIGVE